jgi:hypothetical protein
VAQRRHVLSVEWQHPESLFLPPSHTPPRGCLEQRSTAVLPWKQAPNPCQEAPFPPANFAEAGALGDLQGSVDDAIYCVGVYVEAPGLPMRKDAVAGLVLISERRTGDNLVYNRGGKDKRGQG